MSDATETPTARELWERWCAMASQDEQWAWLERHELLVDGEWRQLNTLDIYRSPHTPLLLYTDWPDGQHEVPMDVAIPIRPTA